MSASQRPTGCQCHSWLRLFTHRRAKTFLEIVLEHNTVLSFKTSYSQPRLDCKKGSAAVRCIVCTGSSGFHLLLMCLERRHNKMARSVQECHKCLSEGEEVSINTSCFFFPLERKRKQRFEDVSVSRDEWEQKDGLKQRIIPCLEKHATGSLQLQIH